MNLLLLQLRNLTTFSRKTACFGLYIDKTCVSCGGFLPKNRCDHTRIGNISRQNQRPQVPIYCTIWDYLLWNLALATATRPSALKTVLVSDYDTSRVSEANRIILMPMHKRNKDGHAMLGMNPQMQAEMTTLYSKEKRILHVTQIKKKKIIIHIIYLPGYNSNKIHVNVNIFLPLTNSFLPSLLNNGTVVQWLTQSRQITSILSSMLLSNNYRT